MWGTLAKSRHLRSTRWALKSVRVPPQDEKTTHVLVCVPNFAVGNIFVTVSRLEALVASVSGGGCTQRIHEKLTLSLLSVFVRVCKNSSTYWEGKADMETLQRIYGISFPDPKMLKEWEKFQEEAKNRDHRKLGRVRTQMGWGWGCVVQWFSSGSHSGPKCLLFFARHFSQARMILVR